jgi:hypothetical protein
MLRFDEDLILLLDPPRIGGWIRCDFQGRQTLKHLIESLGVPHTEVGRLTSGNEPRQLYDLAQDGERVEVLPAAPVELGRDEARFLLDNHLGRLASYLRILGLDARYRNDFQDAELASLAEEEDRILLTRDKRLLMRVAVRRGAWLRSLQPRTQLAELNRRFGLIQLARPFQRCPRCNGQLQPVNKADVLDRLQPLTRTYFFAFQRCADCGQVYWKGSHYERMLGLIQSLRD